MFLLLIGNMLDIKIEKPLNIRHASCYQVCFEWHNNFLGRREEAKRNERPVCPNNSEN
jgi:hypothetical protein